MSFGWINSTQVSFLNLMSVVNYYGSTVATEDTSKDTSMDIESSTENPHSSGVLVNLVTVDTIKIQQEQTLNECISYFEEQLKIASYAHIQEIIFACKQIINQNCTYEKKMEKIGFLIFIFETDPNILNELFTQYTFDKLQLIDPIALLMKLMHNKIKDIKSPISSSSKAFKQSFISGKVHVQLLMIANLALYKSGKINLGGILLAINYAKRHFTDEHRQQIITVLNSIYADSNLRKLVEAPIQIHKEMEPEIRLALKIPASEPLNSRLIHIAIFKAVLADLPQYYFNRNCYAIASMYVLNHNHLNLLYKAYIDLVQTNKISINNATCDFPLNLLIEEQHIHSSVFKQKIPVDQIAELYFIKKALIYIGLSHISPTLKPGITEIDIEEFFDIVLSQAYPDLKIDDRVIRFKQIQKFIISFREDNLQSIMLNVVRFLVINHSEIDSSHHLIFRSLHHALLEFFVGEFKEHNNDPYKKNLFKAAGTMYMHILKTLKSNLWLCLKENPNIKRVNNQIFDGEQLLIEVADPQARDNLISLLRFEEVLYFKNQKFEKYSNVNELKKIFLSIIFNMSVQAIDFIPTHISLLIISQWITRITQNNGGQCEFSQRLAASIAATNEKRRLVIPHELLMNPEIQAKTGCKLIHDGGFGQEIIGYFQHKLNEISHNITNPQEFVKCLCSNLMDIEKSQPGYFEKHSQLLVTTSTPTETASHQFTISIDRLKTVWLQTGVFELQLAQKINERAERLLSQPLSKQKAEMIMSSSQGVLVGSISNLNLHQLSAKLFYSFGLMLFSNEANKNSFTAAFNNNLDKISWQELVVKWDFLIQQISLVTQLSNASQFSIDLREKIADKYFNSIELAKLIRDLLKKSHEILPSLYDLETIINDCYDLPQTIDLGNLNYSRLAEVQKRERLVTKFNFATGKLCFYQRLGAVDKLVSDSDAQKYLKLKMHF